ncbi:MAG: hypothetical protein ACFFDI_23450 [Promethearchaeota archaeon]
MVKITIGPPVKGDDLYDREDEIAEIWKKLQDSSILLVAPRRFGKTSVMFHCRDHPQNGFKVFYLDIGYISTPSDFMIELIRKLSDEGTVWRRLGTKIKNFFQLATDRLEEVDFVELKVKLRKSTEKTWRDLGNELIDILGNSDINILLILDEFPVMIKNMIAYDKKEDKNDTRLLLQWLRHARISIETRNKIRFIIGGSIGIERLLDSINEISSINDLEKVKIGEFSMEAARNFIKDLFKSEGLEIDKNKCDTIMEVVGTPIPYFIQVLVSVTLKESNYKLENISPRLILETYYETMLGVDYKTYFQHYSSRLCEYYTQPNEVDTIKSILTAIATKNEVAIKELYELYCEKMKQSEDKEGFSYLMAELENDFYLRFNPKNQTYSFNSKVLQDWWKRYYGLLVP